MDIRDAEINKLHKDLTHQQQEADLMRKRAYSLQVKLLEAEEKIGEATAVWPRATLIMLEAYRADTRTLTNCFHCILGDESTPVLFLGSRSRERTRAPR